jgi:hypothetical protein
VEQHRRCPEGCKEKPSTLATATLLAVARSLTVLRGGHNSLQLMMCRSQRVLDGNDVMPSM